MREIEGEGDSNGNGDGDDESESLIVVETTEALRGETQKPLLLALNYAMLSLGTCGGPLLMHLYYIYSGSGGPSTRLVLMDPFLFVASAIVGVFTGLDDYLYAYGVVWLLASTLVLLIVTQLTFTARFAFLLVRQQFTPYSINSVYLLTIAARVLALNTSSDWSAGESDQEYYAGFFMMLGAAALYRFILPPVELTYKKAKRAVSYLLVLEIQLVMCFFATAFCTVGMLVRGEQRSRAIPTEAKNYELGEALYYVVLVGNTITWQFFFLGVIGVIFCASSLFSGIMIAVLLPVTEILAVICFQETFQAEKGVSLAVSLWGLASYFYGEFKLAKKEKERAAAAEAD
ncbi:hypothetical protein ACJRO7_004004 [Eucalyptus globulus]|uniref:Probable purine permease n=1 Tax=Eucalyptus globulus TaxID=34317 RepID=A0ABD3IY15_EUCGL